MIRLDEVFREARGRQLIDLIEQDVLNAYPRYRRVREYRDLYYGFATADMPLPWPGASNIHLPVMMEKVETLVPMLMAAFWGVEPVVNVRRSPEEYDPEQTDEVEQFMNFVVEKDIEDFYETFECWMRSMGIDGMSVLCPEWERKLRDVSMMYTLKALYDEGDTTASGDVLESAREKTAMELLIDIFGPMAAPRGLIDAQPIDPDMEFTVIGSQWVVEFLEDRVLFAAHVEFLPATHVDEVRARVRRKIVERDAAVVELLEFEDVIVPYRTRNLQDAVRVSQRYWLDYEEIEEKVRTGEWNISEQELEWLENSVGYYDDARQIDPKLQDQKDDVVGEQDSVTAVARAMPAGYEEYSDGKVLMFRTFTKDVVEPDGPRVEVIYHMPYALRKIVGAEHLDERYPHGKRPFITAKYLPVPKRWAALGVGDQFSAINLEINSIINYINNNQELINNPFFFYEPTALNADNLVIRPGQGIPVMSVQGVLMPQFPQQPLANMSQLSTLMMFGDRLAISPLNAGSTQMKNAPSTARGTLALLGEGHVKTDMLVTRLQRGPWYELMEQLHGLYEEFCPDEKWYYITRNNQSVPHRMNRTMLRGRYEFSFKGNTVNTNREVLRTLAQVRYNTVMTHPDYATDPVVREAALRDLLKYWGEGTDIDRLIPAKPGQGAYTHPPMRQQDENKVLEMGVPMQVLPTDAHAEHLQVMDEFERTDMFKAMPQHAVGMWATHKMQHMDQLRTQIAQMNSPVSPGAGNNVPQGMTLAGGGNDLGVMEGGNMR